MAKMVLMVSILKKLEKLQADRAALDKKILAEEKNFIKEAEATAKSIEAAANKPAAKKPAAKKPAAKKSAAKKPAAGLYPKKPAAKEPAPKPTA